MKTITYMKEHNLSIPVKSLKFTDIPVMESVRLSLYQKYVILLMQQGVKAESKEQLIESLAKVLNFSTLCITEFIDYLFNEGHIIFDGQKYKLKSELNFTIDPKSNAMFADLDVKLADCDSIVFVEGISEFFLEEDFSTELFRQKPDESINSAPAPSVALKVALANKKDKISSLIERNFENTNKHLQPDFSFNFNSDVTPKTLYEFSAFVKYQYDEETHKSIKIDTKIPPDNILPKEYIDALAKNIDVDDEIPRFILLDKFYTDVQQQEEEIVVCEENISITNLQVEEFKNAGNVKSHEIEKINKKHRADKKILDDDRAVIEKEKAKIDKRIATNNDLINESLYDNNDSMVDGLKLENASLEKTKLELDGQIAEYQEKISKLEDAHNLELNTLKTELAKHKEEAKKANQNALKYQAQCETLKTEKSRSIKENEPIFNPTIRITLDKYSNDDIFCRKLCIICTSLDKAISASDCMAFDEVENSIDMMRETYRKVLQIVFDLLLKKKATGLSDYFSSVYGYGMELQKYFDSLKIAGCYQNIKDFHRLANAVGHLVENGEKKEDNEKTVNEFKNKLSRKEREKILLSIPKFFNTIALTKKEMKVLSDKLRI